MKFIIFYLILVLVEIFKLFNIGFDFEFLVICVKLCEVGVNFEVLVLVV